MRKFLLVVLWTENPGGIKYFRAVTDTDIRHLSIYQAVRSDS